MKIRLRLLAAIALTSLAPLAMAAERIPFKQDDDDFGPTMWRVVLVTAGMALIAIGAVYVMRRKGLVPAARAGGEDAVRLLQTVRTGPRTSLLVVRFGAQRMLLGQSESGLSVLASEPVEKAP